jgi:hypothetical protein
MLLDCPYLSLAPTWVADIDPRNVAVVLAVDALRLRRAGRCEPADATDALFDFEALCRSRTWAVRNFVQQVRLASAYSAWLDDNALICMVADGLRTGTLACVHPKDGAADSDPVQLLRRLVRAVETQTRGHLRDGSKQFRLVVGIDLRGLPDRESYEVVARVEAQRVLSEIARQSGRDLGDLLGKAKDALSPDWRPPLKPNGVVLLRRIYTPSVMVASLEPALTPSQMKALSQKDWIEIEVVDQDGEPYPTHYRLELASSDVREGELDENGCLNVSEIESGTCKLTVGEIRLAADAGEPTEEPAGEGEPEKAAASDAGQGARIPDDDGGASESDIFDDAWDELEDEPVDWDDEDEGSS